MDEKKKNREFSRDEKLTILKEHLVGGTSVSEVCQKYDLQPSVYYAWQKILFERGGFDVQKGHSTENKQLKKAEKRIKQLEEKGRKKDETIVELMQEYIALKKSTFGES